MSQSLFERAGCVLQLTKVYFGTKKYDRDVNQMDSKLPHIKSHRIRFWFCVQTKNYVDLLYNKEITRLFDFLLPDKLTFIKKVGV